MSRELSRLPLVECETEPSGGEQGLQRRTTNLLLVSMIVLDTVSVWSTGVAGWLAESRCVKREVSRPQAADGYGHGSCDGQLLDADAEAQRRLRSTSGLPSRHGTAMGLGCYVDAMRRPWGGVVVRGARGLTFTENGPFTV